MFLLNLSGFKTVIKNYAVSFSEQCAWTCSYIVNYMYTLRSQ